MSHVSTTKIDGSLTEVLRYLSGNTYRNIYMSLMTTLPLSTPIFGYLPFILGVFDA